MRIGRLSPPRYHVLLLFLCWREVQRFRESFSFLPATQSFEVHDARRGVAHCRQRAQTRPPRRKQDERSLGRNSSERPARAQFASRHTPGLKYSASAKKGQVAGGASLAEREAVWPDTTTAASRGAATCLSRGQSEAKFRPVSRISKKK